MAKPDNRTLERHWWDMTRAVGPTGMAAHLGAQITSVLGHANQGTNEIHSADEQAAMLLQQAKRAYEVVKSRAQAAYAHKTTTSARIKVLKAFGRREPLLCYERWIHELQFQAISEGNLSLWEGIRGALSPRLPTVASGNAQQRIAAQQYYRWVVARVSEHLLAHREKSVSAAIRWVIGLNEAEEWRKRAGLMSGVDPDKDPEYRARQIYYKEINRDVWRLMVAAGVGHI